MFAFQDVAGGLLATVNSKITCLPQGLLKCEIDRSIAPPLRTHTYYINKGNTKKGEVNRGKGKEKKRKYYKDFTCLHKNNSRVPDVYDFTSAGSLFGIVLCGGDEDRNSNAVV